MNHVCTIAWRPASSCLRTSVPKRTTEKTSLRRALSILTDLAPTNSGSVSRTFPRSLLPRQIRWQLQLDRRNIQRCISGPTTSRSFSSSPQPCFRESRICLKLKPYKSPSKIDQGLTFRTEDLNPQELRRVFGAHHPPSTFANRLLRILHARRVDGTLDIDPPEEVTRQLDKYPYAAVDGLKWLRKNYPVDEDEAIFRRIEREEAEAEKESPAQLMQRAEDIGLYKPQSGSFGAKLGEEGDVFGESELEKIRATNVARAEKEEKELEEHIEKLQAEVKEQKALQVKNEDAVEGKTSSVQRMNDSANGFTVSTEQRPPNLYEKWILKQKTRATSPLKLDSPEVEGMTLTRRLLPSLLFVTAVTAVSYLYSQYWVPPLRTERLWPNISLAFATGFGIISANLFIYVLWTFPPAWRLLNRYFLTIPATPIPFSTLGSTFSHQSLIHLSMNMAWLLILGVSMHEEVGRGTFLGIYFAAGVIGSWVSLANFAVRKIFVTSSLGASGAVAGVIAAYCTIHANDKFSFFLLPSSWQEQFQFKGWVFLVAVLVAQTFGFLSPTKKIDYASHLAGYATGIVSGLWWGQNREKEKLRQRAEMKWFERILGKRPEKK